MRQLRARWILASLILACAAPAAALPPGQVRDYELVVAVDYGERASSSTSPAASGAERARRGRKLAEAVARRLTHRLEVAGATRADVEVRSQTKLLVRARTRGSRDWVEAVLMGRGFLTVRPVLDERGLWRPHFAKIPDRVHVRGLDPGDQVHLWCAERAPLLELATMAHSPGHALHVVPARRGGWRTLWLGAPLLDHDSITEVRRERSAVGTPYAELRLGEQGVRAWREVAPNQRLAAVVDGEVIDVFSAPSSASRRDRIALQCAEEWVPAAEREECVELVAARLSAPLPFQLVVLESPSP